MRFTWWPATRASLRLLPKGAVRAPSQAGRRAGPGHAGEGQATHSRPDPARRSGSLAHAGQRAADDDPADHRGHGCQRRAHPYRRVWHLRPPACLGLSAQNGLPRARRLRPRRGWRRVLRGAPQHDRGVLVPAALLAPPAPGDLAGEAAALSGVLPVRAQRTPSRQSPPRRARCRLGRMTHPTNTPEANKSHLGNLMTASGIEALPSTRLYELWLEQKFFDDTVALRAGQLAADTEFLVSQYATLFVNATFGWPAITAADLPSGGPAYPLATPGIRLKVAPTD